MEVVAAAPRCQLLLIMLMAAMLLPGMKVSPLLVWRKIARTIELQENIGKDTVPDWPGALPHRPSSLSHKLSVIHLSPPVSALL
ncbi:hypothetical protein STEG23_024215 [Scotinomys teguina]